MSKACDKNGMFTNPMEIQDLNVTLAVCNMDNAMDRGNICTCILKNVRHRSTTQPVHVKALTEYFNFCHQPWEKR